MVTLQEYLDNKYPTKLEKEQLKEIIINDEIDYDDQKAFEEIEGQKPNLSEYPNLEKVIIDGSCLKTKLTKLVLNNPQLISLDVYRNKLTELDLSNCVNLKELVCRDNSLTKLELNPHTKLEKLNIYRNNFSESDLTLLEWIKKGFSSQEVKEWANLGLSLNDYCFASYLTKQGHQSQGNLDLEELRKECDDKSQKSQEWLQQNYPDKKETKSIYLNQPLAGVLDCSEYNRLEKIFISTSVDRSKLEIKKGSYRNGRWETKIISCISAQTWLDENYPKDGICLRKKEDGKNHSDFGKTREKITKLNINEKFLEGILDISDFTNLEKLNCKENYLTNLKVNNCPKLKEISCSNNQLTTLELGNLAELKYLHCSNNNLTSLDLGNLAELGELTCYNNYLTQIIYPTNLDKITHLNIRDNNLLSQDLTIFSQFKNLKDLKIGNTDKNQINQGIYNCFYGSLEPLKDLNKLESLHISNTDIDSGLEFMPESIEHFYCSADLRKDAKVKTIRNAWICCGEDVKKYREVINQSSQAQQWLDENYPLNEPCKREEDKGNYNKKREGITSLGISDQKIKGGLRLTGFTKLESLECDNNQLTHLDLGDCKNLRSLNASDNQLSSLHFLKLVPELEYLRLSNNPNLPKDSLKFIADELKELESLWVSNCPVEGSLKPLEKLNRLRDLYITNTDLSEGLEYLPESLTHLVCDSDHSHKSIKIIKELEKHLEGKEEETDWGWSANIYYNLSKWKKNKNNSVATTVPLEKLYVIRGNLMRFLNKWGVREGKTSEVSKLQNPKEIRTYWYVGESGQWIARGAAITGGIIAATTDPILGGVLAATSPVIEVCASQLKERIYEAQEKLWDTYSEDLEDLLNSYHELLGIIETIVIGKKGEVNEALQELKEEIEAFLTRYDEDNNRMVDIEELKTKEGKAKFAEDLNDKESNQLHRIIEAIEGVKKEVINYHRRNENDEKLLELAEVREITEKLKKIQAEENVKELEKQKKDQERLRNYQQIKKQLEVQKSFLSQKEQKNDEEPKLLERINELLFDIEKKIAELEVFLAKDEQKEIKNPTSESWWEKGKKIFCCGKDKNEPSIKEQLSLENPEKLKELQEFIDNQEETKEDHQVIDLDKHFEEKEQLQTNIEIPSK